MPEAYQRLLLDALNGDASLFARADEVETAWGIIDPILNAWRERAQPPMENYEHVCGAPSARHAGCGAKAASGSICVRC